MFRGSQPGQKMFGSKISESVHPLQIDPKTGKNLLYPYHYRLKTIEINDYNDSCIYGIRLGYSNYTKSKVLGRNDYEPDQTFELPIDVKIAKVYTCFSISKDRDGNTLTGLVQFKLIDYKGNVVYNGGKNSKGHSNWF